MILSKGQIVTKGEGSLSLSFLNIISMWICSQMHIGFCVDLRNVGFEVFEANSLPEVEHPVYPYTVPS